VREISDEALQLALAERPDLLEPVRELGLRSSLVVPLTARGGTVGALALATTRESGRTLDEGDLELAAEVARRAAVAVDNARLFHALEDQSRLTTTITDSAASALFMLDTSGRATYMNPAAEAMTGWTVDELRDQRLHDVIHHVHADGSALAFRDCVIAQTLLGGGELRGHEDLFIRRDGTFFPVRCSATPIAREGGLAGALLEVVDVTEEKRVRAEADARAEAARALEFVGDGVFVVDAAGIVRLWNRAAEAITGIDHAEVVGRELTDALPVWADIRERVPVGRVPDVSATRPETLPIEIDGRERWLSISGVAFVEGTVYAFRDLTEEYAIERLKSDFVSTVSHELRTPLAAIYGAAMTLQRTDVALGDDQRIGLLGVVAGESERLARIVNDVLWASRLDSGVLEVSIESCDAGALATAVVAAARAHLPPTIELALAVERGIPAVAADADKVRQVLVNLVDNAIKYSPDGGLVEVRVEAADHGVRFVVSDRGLGIPPTEHGRIFEKFFRLDPNLTRGVGGTGLGLYICRELIRRMDGRIWVESEEGAGSVFTFELPEAPS
jgi:PAS domain S-box-containing protein